MKSLIMIVLAGLPFAFTSSAQSPVMADVAPHAKVILVELFTSEGCSSCPPADALLRQINETRTQTGDLIIGISEHVTYWNSLGWSDPFSSETYTNRQNAYSTHFGLDSVYTPQMVVNGTEQFVGSDRQSLMKAIRKEQDHTDLVALHILSISRAGNELIVDFAATTDATHQGVDVMAVLTDDMDQSSVIRGENAGRSLTHTGVARVLSRIAKLETAPSQTIHIPIPASIHDREGHHLILFAQARETGRIFASDSKQL